MPYTILIADHDPLQFELFDLIFHVDGYTLETFTDGQDVLAYLREHTPDLAILDTGTPSVDGFDLCRKMKSIKRLKDIPIVLVTSSHPTLTSEIKGLAKVVKADLVIPKPLGDKNLRERVKNLLGERTPHAPENEAKDEAKLESKPKRQTLESERLPQADPQPQIDPDANTSTDARVAEKLQALDVERQRLHAQLLPTDRSQESNEMKKLRELVALQEEQIEVLGAYRLDLETRLAKQKGPPRLRRWLT